MARIARGDGPSGFSLAERRTRCASPSSAATTSSGRPASYGAMRSSTSRQSFRTPGLYRTVIIASRGRARSDGGLVMCRHRPTRAVLVVLALVAAPSAPRAVDAPDWSARAREATAILSDYLRIDTTNPPGRERAAAQFLRSLLARD